MHPPKNKTAKSSKAKRTSSLVSSNSLSSSPSVSLIFALLLASYPQTAGAAPGKTSRAEDPRVAKKALSNRNLQSDLRLPIMRRYVVKRDLVGVLGRRDVWSFDFPSILASFNPFNPFNPSQNGDSGMNNGGNPGNGNGNGNGNGGNSGHTTTPHDNNPQFPTSTKKTSTTDHAQSTPAQSPTSSTPHTSTSPLPAAMVSTGTNNEQTSDTTDFSSETETESNGSGTGTTRTHSFTTGPPSSPNNSPYNPGQDPPISMGSGSGPPSSQSGSTRGLVIGLVVSLVLLLVIGALAAFLFLRRLRKKRQERAASPYNDTAPWLAPAKTEPSEEGYVSEKTETREGSVVSYAPSISSEPQMRARTPGGSSAIPVPYDPSEISDDVSAHFTFFPRDDSIGVPVPYPLALHIPARVAKAMAERDTRWQQYDNLERQPHLHGQSPSIVSDDLMTIPDRSSRRSTNARRSMTDSILSGDGYYAPSQRLSSIQYSRHPDSQSEFTRSDVGGHGDNPSILGSENGDPLTSPISVADFPIPPPPAMARSHGSQPSNRRLRQTSAAASGGTSYSPRLLSVSENPFATNQDLDPSIDTDRSSDDDDGTRTPTPLAYDSRRLSGLSAVGGGAGAERVTMRDSPARTMVLRQSNLTSNPFDDASIVEVGDDRRVSSATAITEPGSIRDSEVYAGVIETVYAFPTPPDPTRRPSVS